MGDFMKILGVSNENLGVSNENLGVSNENLWVSNENLGVSSQKLGSSMKIWVSNISSAIFKKPCLKYQVAKI